MKGLRFDVGDQVLFGDKRAVISAVGSTTLDKYEGTFRTTSVEITVDGKKRNAHIEDLRNATTLDHLYD